MSRPYRTSSEAIEIIYADEFLVVVNKPTLLLSVPGRGEEKKDCLITRLAVEFPNILTVHRLDWETSGLT
ncbi:MAG: RNA pseudouridine synthase, partial [Gammaproteobacteria bacterium]|nr:RNA pseudouridine synthase [Gammaproteobacteria bacterium]